MGYFTMNKLAARSITYYTLDNLYGYTLPAFH